MNILEQLSLPLHQTIGYENRVVNADFGVEIEVEGFNLPLKITGWNTHNEGSLRGEGREFVTRGAVTREGLAKCMYFLKKTLEQNNSIVAEQSHRASTHIHINMQERSAFDVLGSVVIFSLLEPLFMRLCGPNRDGNLFYPWYS